MSQGVFMTETYFDLSEVSFADLFTGHEHVWDALSHLNDYLARQFETGAVKANYEDSTNVYIGEGTRVEKNVQIKGPAIIGKNCEIRHGAYMRLGVLIGDNVVVGHGTEIKHSILMNDVAVPHLNVVLDSILGNRVNFAGGSMTANFRLDKQPVKLKFNNHKTETGLLKFGAVMGDDASIGVNCVLNPGTLLGKGTMIHPLASVKGVHPAGTKIT